MAVVFAENTKSTCSQVQLSLVELGKSHSDPGLQTTTSVNIGLFSWSVRVCMDSPKTKLPTLACVHRRWLEPTVPITCALPPVHTVGKNRDPASLVQCRMFTLNGGFIVLHRSVTHSALAHVNQQAHSSLSTETPPRIASTPVRSTRRAL